MTDVFVSYARQDKAIATQLVKVFDAQRWDVFWDTEIPPGKKWADHIHEQIGKAKCVVAIWSPRSVKSDWVVEEVRIGRDKLVPVSIEGALPPFGFGGIHCEDINPWLNRESDDGLRRVLETISARVSASQPLTIPRAAFWGPKRIERLRYWASVGVLSALTSAVITYGIPLGGETLSWHRAAADGSLHHYEMFIKKYPSGQRAEEARRRIDSLARNPEQQRIMSDFVARYLAVKPDKMAQFVRENFADRVSYFKEGEVSNTRVIELKDAYFTRFPGSDFQLEPDGVTIVSYDPVASRYTLRYFYRYSVWNASTTLCGMAATLLEFHRTDAGAIQITTEKQDYIQKDKDCPPRHEVPAAAPEPEAAGAPVLQP